MVERTFGGALAIVLAANAVPQVRADAASPQRAAEGRRDASDANTAYNLLADLTTEIGPRRGGTEAEARAGMGGGAVAGVRLRQRPC